jgi:hypothetical protein
VKGPKLCYFDHNSSEDLQITLYTARLLPATPSPSHFVGDRHNPHTLAIQPTLSPIMPSSRPRPPRLQFPSLTNSLPLDKLRPILSHIAPNTTLGPIKDIKSTQLARLYSLTMSDNRQLMLSFSPSLAVRLLRHEVTNLTSEATLVYFIQESQRRQETFGPTPGEEIDRSSPVPLLELVPRLLKHSSNNKEMAYPYSIFEAVPGSPVSMISTSLNDSERNLLDTQIGIIARSLASLTSPGTFGQVSKVLPDPF